MYSSREDETEDEEVKAKIPNSNNIDTFNDTSNNTFNGGTPPQNETTPQPQRITNEPTYLQDYKTSEGLSEKEEVQNFSMFTTCSDPKFFQEAIQYKKWRDAMDLEMEEKMNIDTCQLCNTLTF